MRTELSWGLSGSCVLRRILSKKFKLTPILTETALTTYFILTSSLTLHKQSKKAQTYNDGPLGEVPEGEREYTTELRTQVIEQEAKERLLLAEKAASEEESAVLKGELVEAVRVSAGAPFLTSICV